MTDLIRTTFTGGPSGDWVSTMRVDRLLGGDAQDSVDQVEDFWTELKGVMNSAITITINGDVTVVDPLTGEPTGLEQVTPRSMIGLDTADALPWQTQARIVWQTGTWIGGRQVKGVTYIPALTEAANTATGIPNSGVLISLAAAGTSFASATTCVPGIYSKKHHNTYPITGFKVDTKWSLLRSRR